MTADDFASTACQFIELDLKDPTYRRLAKFAGRIKKLLIARPNDPHLRDTLDLFLGAIYALALAKRGGFVDRPKRSTQATAITTRAGDVATGKVRMDGKWMAGFHFNSALFRTAAVYHRLLKIVIDNPKTGDTVAVLRPEVDRRYLTWTRHQWSRINADWIHGEVTRLKHMPNATLSQRRTKFEHAVDGIDELLNLIEAYVRR
jgi:hypothetical protein